MHDPQTQKEDCELKCFLRLSRRLKEEFPRLAICLIADALYCCQTVVAQCGLFGWKYILTIKEGRQRRHCCPPSRKRILNAIL